MAEIGSIYPKFNNIRFVRVDAPEEQEAKYGRNVVTKA